MHVNAWFSGLLGVDAMGQLKDAKWLLRKFAQRLPEHEEAKMVEFADALTAEDLLAIQRQGRLLAARSDVLLAIDSKTSQLALQILEKSYRRRSVEELIEQGLVVGLTEDGTPIVRIDDSNR